jgi:hypothetical protein
MSNFELLSASCNHAVCLSNERKMKCVIDTILLSWEIHPQVENSSVFIDAYASRVGPNRCGSTGEGGTLNINTLTFRKQIFFSPLPP